MERKTVSGIILTLLLVSVLTLAFNVQPAKASLKVHNIDTGEDFGTIQDAIDDSDTLDGHTIFVDAGIYYEYVVVNKAVSLIGENRETTIIDGSGEWIVVKVTVPYVTISGFTIRNGDGWGLLLEYTGNHNIIGNTIINNQWGFSLFDSGGSIIRDNKMIDNDYNLGVFGTIPSEYYNIDMDTSNEVDGKPVYYLIDESNLIIEPSSYPEIGYLGLVNCFNITIRDQKMTNNYEGLLLVDTEGSVMENVQLSENFSGLVLENSTNNTFKENCVRNNIHEGIFLVVSEGNIFSSNMISDNGWGVRIDISDSNVIHDNDILNNDIGISMFNSIDNDIYHNNIINNVEQVKFWFDGYPNIWDDGYPSGGNYWSDHVTVDDYSGIGQDELGSDGIVDVPYIIDDFNRDMYPLVHRWPIPATVDFKAWNKGKWISVYIELIEPYDVRDVDVSTVKLNDTIAIGKPTGIGDYDNDGILDLMAKFDRAELLDWLAMIGCPQIGNYYHVTLTITGKLANGKSFEGSKSVWILN